MSCCPELLVFLIVIIIQDALFKNPSNILQGELTLTDHHDENRPTDLQTPEQLSVMGKLWGEGISGLIMHHDDKDLGFPNLGRPCLIYQIGT